MKKLFISLAAALVTAASASAQQKAVPVTQVSHIGGFMGQRMVLNRDVYLKQFPIDSYVDFIVKRQHTDWNWTQAEQHGKWMESAILSAAHSGDAALMLKANQVLSRIIASQEPSGYVGATAASYRSAERPLRGMDAYELYFVFHAFMTAYEVNGDREALRAAERLADYFLTHFGDSKQEFWPSPTLRYPDNVRRELSGTSQFAGHSVHYCWEGTLLCDPMARLYELTGKKKYLDWSLWQVNNIDRWGGWDAFSRLDSVADGRLGVDQLQPYVHSHTFQMNFMGFLRLYRATGDTTLLRKVRGAWDDIHRRQMYITGGVSVAEHYEHGYIKPLSGNAVETCATMSWMQLTQMLLEITGEAKYAEAMERLMLNHVFAAQDALTGTCRYHTPPMGSKPAGYFHGPDCCTASGHLIISKLPGFFYGTGRNTTYINQYMPAQYDGTDFGFVVSGGYPDSEDVTITVTRAPRHEHTLVLRTPDGPRAITRRWQVGDTVQQHLPLPERWVEREHHGDYHKSYLPGGEIMYSESPAQRTPVAFMRGPVVYCVDMVHNPQLHNDDMDFARDLRYDTTQLPVRQPDGSYRCHGIYKGTRVELTLTPFATIGQWWRDGEPRPAHDTVMYNYSIWL